jgi:inner membrane protein
MEPLAHTLAGACLAQSGLKRLTPLASATLIIAATMSDADGACYLHSADLAYAVRRGWTHGLLALLVLPVLLALAMHRFDRHVRRRWAPCEAPARPAALLALAALGMLTHPALDWLNSYGVRLLMPFSDRWFYGDTLFIIDPWLWLLMGGATMIATTQSRAGVWAWLAIAGATTMLLFSSALVPGWARMAWVAAVVAWLVARPWIPEQSRARVAQAALAVTLAYVGAMIAGSRVAEHRVHVLASSRGWAVEGVAAMPVPIDPSRRIVIVTEPDRYAFVPVSLLGGVSERDAQPPLARGAIDPAVDAALAAPFVQGIRRWLRFPSYEVRVLSRGARRVIIRDPGIWRGRRGRRRRESAAAAGTWLLIRRGDQRATGAFLDAVQVPAISPLL